MPNLPLIRSLVLGILLALVGCKRQEPAPAQPAKGETSEAKTPPPAPALPVPFKPKTGSVLGPADVPLLEQIDRENTRLLGVTVPSVVRVTAKHQSDPKIQPSRDLVRPFHQGPAGTRIMPPADPSYGSGVIISRDGYIVTNYHVLEDAVEITVLLHDKRLLPARLVAADSPMDVAVLKVDAKGLTALSWGDSEQVLVGEQVFAIGNPFNLEAGASVSRGIVSAVARVLPESPVEPPHYENFIQTDAAINPGNSGGALINIHGEMIGMNTAIASMSGGNEGVAFAIPSNFVRYAVESLLKNGRVIRGYLGVTWPQSIDEGVTDSMQLDSDRGVLLSGVQPGSPAEAAGLRAGDFITAVDNHKIHGLPHLQIVVSRLPIGKEATVTYIRGGTSQTAKVKVAELPANIRNDVTPGDVQPTPAPTLAKESLGGKNVLSGLQVDALNDQSRKKYSVPAGVVSGVIVSTVVEGSTAQTRGLARGDVISSASLNHGAAMPLMAVKDFNDLSQSMSSDQSVVLLVHHGKGSSFIYLAPRK